MQSTINKSFKLFGITLHGGKQASMIVHPATPNTGILFRRTDLKVSYEETLIEASYKNITCSDLCTKLTNNYGHSISTVEHIMSAFHGMGVDNAIIEVNCDELPILDGSSIKFVNAIENSGIKKLNANRKFLKIKRPLMFNIDDSYIKVTQSDRLEIDYTISYDHELIKNQNFYYQLDNCLNYKKLISNSRTFCFKSEVEQLRRKGLIAGGSLDNAVVLDDNNGILNDKLRHKNEFVKHKILDFIGDIFLLGYPINGSFKIYKGGHQLTRELMKSIMSDSSNWLIEEEKSSDKNYINSEFSKSVSVSF